ncbi:MAG: hypothetical protein WC538_24405 [Thermoanaerobaculia bacterium]|jgi:hypothetical protein
MRNCIELLLTVALLSLIACKPSEPALSAVSVPSRPVEKTALHKLPDTFHGNVSPGELRERYGVIDVVTCTHPEYQDSLRVLLRELPGDSREYELAFYESKGDEYVVIDTSLVAGGYDKPILSTVPGREIPALRAKMPQVDDATYFFVEHGKLESIEEDEGSWQVVR